MGCTIIGGTHVAFHENSLIIHRFPLRRNASYFLQEKYAMHKLINHFTFSNIPLSHDDNFIGSWNHASRGVGRNKVLLNSGLQHGL